MMGFDFTPPLLPLIVGLPLIGAIISVMTPSHRWRASVSVGIAIIQLLVVVALLLALPNGGTAPRYALGGWSAPLGIDLMVDGLAAIMLLATATLVLVLSLYSAWYFSANAKAARFWPLWWLLVAGLNAAFVAADAFNIYVALEMIGLTSVALVALAGSRAALAAALRYALVGLLGSLCYLLGVALLYRAYGTLDLRSLAALAQAEPITWASLSLISVGLLLKTALLPLHFWLPPAHASAPAPVSAVLSALVVKASFYLLVRYWLEVLAPAVTDAGLYFMGALGVAAIFWGCIAAFRARRLKLLVAYSTVAQLGYLFLLFPLAAASQSPLALEGAAVQAVAYFIIAHALAKAAMFAAAGNIQFAYGHDEIDRLQGLASHQPASLFIFAIAGASLIGLPPSGGFIAKWLLLNSAITSGQWWWAVAILCGGLMAAIYIFRVLNLAFVESPPEVASSRSPHRVPTGMVACGFALAMAAVLLGFNAELMLDVLNLNTPLDAAASGWAP